MLLTQKLGSKLQRSKSYCDVYVVSGIHWPPFCKMEGTTSLSVRPCISEQSKACTCLFDTRLPKFDAQDIYMQYIFSESMFSSFIFVSTRATHPYQHVGAHVFACHRRYCSPLSFTWRNIVLLLCCSHKN